MSMRQVIDDCMSAEVTARFDQYLPRTSAIIHQLATYKQNGELPMLTLPYEREDIKEVESIADYVRQNFKEMMVLGTGGSSLGGQTLAALKKNPFSVAAPRVHFVDNVDTHTIWQMLSTLSLKDTFFLIISKSGGTTETITQFLAVIEALKREVGEELLPRQCRIITIEDGNPLHNFARMYSIPVTPHDPKVGGRFSVLSTVGLIPAAAAGLDVKSLRLGAAKVLDDMFAIPEKNQVATGAAIHCALMESGKTVSVLMPYADRLACFALWYKQLWAESIGKQGKGTTPVRAVGSIDQHSQLQLFLDGPKDKFVTMILLASQQPAIELTSIPKKESSLDYLRGKQVGDVMEAMQTGTYESLVKNNVPVRVLELVQLDEFALGGLLMHFMLETIICAGLLEINAYDQPAVEEGKIIAREFLLHKRYQKVAAV